MNIFFFLIIHLEIDMKSRYFQLVDLYFITRSSAMIDPTANTGEKKRGEYVTANDVTCNCIQSFMAVAILVPRKIKQIVKDYDIACLVSLTRSINQKTADCIAPLKLEQMAKYVVLFILMQNGRIYMIKDRKNAVFIRFKVSFRIVNDTTLIDLDQYLYSYERCHMN